MFKRDIYRNIYIILNKSKYLIEYILLIKSDLVWLHSITNNKII